MPLQLDFKALYLKIEPHFISYLTYPGATNSLSLASFTCRSHSAKNRVDVMINFTWSIHKDEYEHSGGSGNYRGYSIWHESPLIFYDLISAFLPLPIDFFS